MKKKKGRTKLLDVPSLSILLNLFLTSRRSSREFFSWKTSAIKMWKIARHFNSNSFVARSSSFRAKANISGLEKKKVNLFILNHLCPLRTKGRRELAIFEKKKKIHAARFVSCGRDSDRRIKISTMAKRSTLLGPQNNNSIRNVNENLFAEINRFLLTTISLDFSFPFFLNVPKMERDYLKKINSEQLQMIVIFGWTHGNLGPPLKKKEKMDCCLWCDIHH